MVPPDTDDPPDGPGVDQKVKDFIDAATRAELERWFGLPSFEQAAEAPPAEEDPDLVAVRERRAAAIAAVDPALVEAHRLRTEPDESLFLFKPNVALVIEKPCAFFDEGMLDRQITIADPREIEISEELREDLKECTPQALLRDLHRPELDFEKTFEIVDMAAEQRLDIVAEVDLAMKTSWKLPKLDASPFVEARLLMEQLREQRKQPLNEILAALPNRRVSE